eukprot:scaffold3380_cov106-Cylindrotheca_fusiformis.AAC.4
MMDTLSVSERLSGERPIRNYRSRPRSRPATPAVTPKRPSSVDVESRRPSVVDTLVDKVLTLSGGKYQKKKLSMRKDQLAELVAQELAGMED